MVYRSEIDGLRAIAVVLVILFHGGFEGFKGGFIGVDVFFVISGYLITSLIVKDIESGRFSIVDFYERRARRILPALFFVMMLCVPVAWWSMEIVDFRNFGRSVVATSLFASNILFWRESNYFGGDAEEKPLLHTWSLAVEEQYYILFPVLMVFIWKSRSSSVAVTLAALALLSLAASEWGWRNAPEANFYLFPFRAWELLAGALCALAHRRRAAVPHDGFAALGLVLIAASATFFDAETPFPSLLALAPVGGTALLLLFAVEGGRVRTALSVGPLVTIGLISYSAYLIHQPLFAFARILTVSEPSFWLMLSLAAASLPLGWLSWRFVEQPFRSRGLDAIWPGRRFLAVSAAGLVGFVALGAVVNFKAEAISPQQITQTFIHKDRTRSETWKAVLRNPDLQDELARFPEGDAINVLIVGDSHSKYVMNALYRHPELFPGFAFRQTVINGACYQRTDPLGRPDVDPRACVREFIADEAEKMSEADWVLLSMHWTDAANVLRHLEATVSALQAEGYLVAIAGAAPVFADNGKLMRAIHRRHDPETIDKALIDATFTAYRNPASGTRDARLREIAARTGAVYLDKASLACPSGVVCDAVTPDLRPLRYDAHHWTLPGADLHAARMAQSGWLEPLRRVSAAAAQ